MTEEKIRVRNVPIEEQLEFYRNARKNRTDAIRKVIFLAQEGKTVGFEGDPLKGEAIRQQITITYRIRRSWT